MEPTNQNKSTAFRLPPEGFNPLTAADKELLLYGIVPRPDKKLDPQNYKLWESIFSKKLTYATPSIKEKKTVNTNPVRPDLTPSSFAGVQIQSGSVGYNFQWISGSWVIPQIEFPGFLGAFPQPPEHYLQTFIGLSSLTGITGNNSIILGTEQTISQVGIRNKVYNLFTYYSIDGATHVVNFSANVGDSVTFLICINTSNPTQQYPAKAYFTLVNNTKSVYLPLPPISIRENSFVNANWGIGSDGSPLAEYSPPIDIKVAQAQASINNVATNTKILNANIGQTSNYVDSGTNKVTSFAQIVGAEEIKITFSNPLNAS